MAAPWFDDPNAFGAWSGALLGVLGGLLGILGGITGWLAPKGIGRRVILPLWWASCALGAGLAVFGVAALFSTQPYAIWYPFVLGGGMLVVLGARSGSRSSRSTPRSWAWESFSSASGRDGPWPRPESTCSRPRKRDCSEHRPPPDRRRGLLKGPARRSPLTRLRIVSPEFRSPRRARLRPFRRRRTWWPPRTSRGAAALR